MAMASLLAAIMLGSPVLVSNAHPKDPAWEFTICANPRDARELAVGAGVFTLESVHSTEDMYYVTRDGGRSWQLRLVADSMRTLDPTCAYDSRGALYVVDMLWPTDSDYRGLALRASRDHGMTWRTTTFAMDHLSRQPLRHFDRPWLAVNLLSPPHRGTVYFNAAEYRSTATPKGGQNFSYPARIFLLRSTDGGQSIQASGVASPAGDSVLPGTITQRGMKGTIHPGQVGVLSDGTVLQAYMGLDGRMYVTASYDGGKTQPYTRIIGGQGSRTLNGVPGHPLAFAPWIPSLAVDQSHGPFRDRVYVAWRDGASGRNQIWMTYSLDRRAREWAKPRPIDDSQPTDVHNVWKGPNSGDQAIAVNARGVVGLLWADRRLGPAGFQPRFSASRDGGKTWLPSVALAAHVGMTKYRGPFGRPAPHVTEKPRSPELYAGDHWGMAADAAGIFHPLWWDDRTGFPQVWTTEVRVEP